jgi:hypothetical protein
MAATNVKKGDRYIYAYLFGPPGKLARARWQFAGSCKVSMTREVKITAISNLKAPVIDFFLPSIRRRA